MAFDNAFGLSKVKHIVVISSCKGGVGKSTIACALAKALAKEGHKVGLLDADFYGPSIPTLFNLKDTHVLVNEFKLLEPIEAEGMKVMSSGLVMGEVPAILRGPMVSKYLQQLLFQTQWGDCDFLVIDMPPGTGDVALTITQSLKISAAIVVTTPQALALADVKRGIAMFHKMNVPILGAVVNMAYFQCTHCQQRQAIGEDTAALSKTLDTPVLAEIPFDAKGNVDAYLKPVTIAVQGL